MRVERAQLKSSWPCEGSHTLQCTHDFAPYTACIFTIIVGAIFSEDGVMSINKHYNTKKGFMKMIFLCLTMSIVNVDWIDYESVGR